MTDRPSKGVFDDVDTSNDNNMLDQVETYRKVLATYETLKSAIHALLSTHGGEEAHLSNEDLARYQELARQRDETLNEMRWLEQQLLDEGPAH